MRMTKEQFEVLQAKMKSNAHSNAHLGKPRHKFNAKPTVNDGIRFDSKKEAKRYEQLKLLQHDGEVLFFLRQCPFHLPGGVRYVVDFAVFWSDGHVSFEDVKGMQTPMFKAKKKQVEDLYPIEIDVI